MTTKSDGKQIHAFSSFYEMKDGSFFFHHAQRGPLQVSSNDRCVRFDKLVRLARRLGRARFTFEGRAFTIDRAGRPWGENAQ